MGRPRTCECGQCPKCLRRGAANARWAAKSVEERRAIVLARDPEKVRVSDRARHRRHHAKRIAAMKSYAQTAAGRAAVRRGMVKFRAENPEKYLAHTKVGNALRDGRLTKGDCERPSEMTCKGRIEAHHDDYSKPLDVRWLCKAHHNELHGVLAAVPA